MENVFEELLKIREEKGELNGQIEEIQAPFKEKMEVLKAEMTAASVTEDTRLKHIGEQENLIKMDLVDSWPYDDQTHIDDATGIQLQRRKSEKPEVKDLKSLLMTVLAFEELPIKKVNFDNRKLITLAGAGVISNDQVEIHRTYNIAVTFPKE